MVSGDPHRNSRHLKQQPMQTSLSFIVFEVLQEGLESIQHAPTGDSSFVSSPNSSIEQGSIFESCETYLSVDTIFTPESNVEEVSISSKHTNSEHRNPWTPWTVEQSQYLRELKESPDNYSFSEIASLINQRFGTQLKSNQCQERWHRCEDESYKKGRWTDEESKDLIEVFQMLGGDLRLVKEEFRHRTLLEIQKRLRILGLIS